MLLKKIHQCLGILLIAACTGVYAQTNLVSNGSFEQNQLCPHGLSDSTSFKQFVPDWKSLNLNSPRYFNSCAPLNSGMSIPINYAGNQHARTGSAYAGISVFRNPQDYDASMGKQRQYLQTQLKSPLKQGRKYYFEMYVSKSDSSTMGFAINNFGAFLGSAEQTSNDSFDWDVTPQIVTNSFYTDKLNWVKISGTYTASGGEKFLTIGRFGNDDASSVQNINGNITHHAYYYLDDIALIDSCTALDNAANQLLGPDSSFCVYSLFSKNINAGNAKTMYYLWDNGSQFPNRTVTDTGRYWVRLTNGSCQAADTIVFRSNQKPSIKLGNDTAICFNTPLVLQSSLHKPQYSYQWYIRTFGTNFFVSSSSTYTINSPDTIIAIATDVNCSHSDTILVRKSNLKRVTLQSDTTICRQVYLPLNVASTGASNYIWNTGSHLPNLTTSTLNTYWVTASDGLCSSTDTLNITFKGALAPIRDTTICETNTLILKADINADSHIWNTGESTPFVFALFEGDYRIKQQKEGCTTLDTTTVIINKIPVISLGRDTNVCVSPFYTINATSPYGTKYKWNTGDTTAQIQVSQTGNYVVTVSNKTCSFSDTVLLRLQINTPFSFGPDKYDCFETGIILSSSILRLDSFLWSTQSRDSFILVNQPGTYWLRTSSGFCTNYDTIELIAKPKPSVLIANDTILCRGQNLLVDAHSPGNRVLWNTGDTTQQITLKTPQTYVVVATNTDGCHASDTIKFDYFPPTKAFTDHEQDICEGSSVLIKPTATLTGIQWFDGQISPTYTCKQGGLVSMIATDSLGCAVTDSVFVHEHALPETQLEPELLACELPVTLTPANVFPVYLWQDSIPSETYEAAAFGQYTLKVKDQFGCSSISSITVTNNCPSDVTVPNVFTPDNNGKNDEIKPDYINIKETTWEIFNRWGQLVFSSTNENESWNGMINGKEAEAGVYYYTLVCKGSRDENIERTGTITLIR